MSLSAVPLLIMSLGCDAAGQLAFKRAASVEGIADASWQLTWRRFAIDPWIWSGIGCFVLEFFLWLAVLSVLPLSRGVLLGSASTLLLLAGGRIFFGERLNFLQLLGALLIAGGVAVVGLG